MILVQETDERFYLAKSTVPNAGTGVFSKVPLQKGDWLEIIGAQVEVGSLADKCTTYAKNYKFAATGSIKKGKKVIDHTRLIVPMGFGGMVNHAPSREIQNAEIGYLQKPTRNSAAGKAVYYFLRNIAKDEEILGNYGEDWGGVFDWASDCATFSNDIETEWERFLDHDLYNLGKLKSQLVKESYA